MKVTHGQTFCPLFVVSKKRLHDYEPVSTPFAQLGEKRMEQFLQDATEDMQFFQPPPGLLQLPLFTLKLFSNSSPRLFLPPSIPDWRVGHMTMQA